MRCDDLAGILLNCSICSFNHSNIDLFIFWYSCIYTIVYLTVCLIVQGFNIVVPNKGNHQQKQYIYFLNSESNSCLVPLQDQAFGDVCQPRFCAGLSILQIHAQLPHSVCVYIEIILLLTCIIYTTYKYMAMLNM